MASGRLAANAASRHDPAMVSPPSPVAALISDPAWLAHRYDPEYDAVHFVHADRTLRSRVPFLVDSEMRLADAPVVIARGEALAALASPPPVHFIFHSAFCCSTLLARAFDLPGIASSLKEPQLLADLVGWRHRGGDPKRIGQVLNDSLRLLARPFEAGEAAIVKPSNVVNGLVSAMLTIRPAAAAVLLYAPLRVFLASIARKGMDGRLWVRELLSKQLVDGTVNLGFEPPDYLRHTDLQAAAVGWLAQHALFATIATKWPERVRTLDSEVFVSRPGDALAATATLFGLRMDEAAIDAVVADVFGRDAKNGAPFAVGQRAAARESGATPFADEIEKVAIWAEAVAATAGVSLVLPGALLPD